MNNACKILLSVLSFLLLVPREKITPEMSGLLKSRSRRLFFIYDGKAIPRSDVEHAKQLARLGIGCLHAVWAYNADEARRLISLGISESICKARIGSLGARRFVKQFPKPKTELKKTRISGIEKRQKRIERQCAWCQSFLDKHGRYIPKPQGEYMITHTICAACFEKQRKEIEKAKKAGLSDS